MMPETRDLCVCVCVYCVCVCVFACMCVYHLLPSYRWLIFTMWQGPPTNTDQKLDPDSFTPLWLLTSLLYYSHDIPENSWTPSAVTAGSEKQYCALSLCSDFFSLALVPGKRIINMVGPQVADEMVHAGFDIFWVCDCVCVWLCVYICVCVCDSFCTWV